MTRKLSGAHRKQISKPKVDAVLRQFEFREGVRAEELPVDTLVSLSNQMRRAIDESATAAAGTVE